MSYSFLKKAKAQPDLSDFCEYVNKPLMILEDILQRYEDLQLAKKVTTENLEIYHKCDSILQKHLPEMVDNFCNFSFEYRNSEKISIDDSIALTAKEILLKNLAKIIEEVKLIEKDFNRNNSFQTIVQTKLLSNYGFQPELSLETGKVKKDSIELNNKFDYEKFVENNEFKKTVAVHDTTDSLEVINDIEEAIDEDEIKENNEPGLFSAFTIVLGKFLVVTVIVGFFAFTGRIDEENANKLAIPFAASVDNINLTVKELHPKSDYSGLSNEELSNTYLRESNFITPWGTHITVSPYQINRYVQGKGTEPNMKTDGYTLEFDLTSKNSSLSHKQSCQIVANIANKFEMVKFGEYAIKTTKPLTQEDFVKYCDDENSTPINFSRDTITLVSK
jgi:hypothetical protein